jgi:hypothetical protein
VAAEIALAIASRSSQRQVLPSGTARPARSSAERRTTKPMVFNPAGTPNTPSSIVPSFATFGATADRSSTSESSRRSASAPRAAYSRRLRLGMAMRSGASRAAIRVASLSR